MYGTHVSSVSCLILVLPKQPWAIKGDQLLRELTNYSFRKVLPYCRVYSQYPGAWWKYRSYLEALFGKACYYSALPSFYVYFISIQIDFKIALLHDMKASRLLCSDREQGSCISAKAETEVCTLRCLILPPNVLPPEHRYCGTWAAGQARRSCVWQPWFAMCSAQGEGRHLQEMQVGISFCLLASS